MHRPTSVVTIGSFDGVHVGHAALVGRARAIAEASGENTRVVAMALDPHPAATLAPERVPPRLTTFERRAALLGAAGADEVIRLEPTPELLRLTPEEFLTSVVADLRPIAIVEGPDFRFGHRRAGDVEMLRTLGRKMGFSAEVVEPIEVPLTDGSLVRASSSIARWLLQHGRVRDAGAVLGRCYEVSGEVQRGDRRGREIGYPTANLRTETLAPGDGVYAGWADLEDGRRFIAAISIGTKPTFGGEGRAVEAYLLTEPERAERDMSGSTQADKPWSPLPGVPEYGWPLRLTFEHWVREQIRFDGLAALLDQMGRDCDRIAGMMSGTEGGSGSATTMKAASKEATCP